MTRCPFCDKVVAGGDADTPIVEHLWAEHMASWEWPLGDVLGKKAVFHKCAVCGSMLLNQSSLMSHLGQHGGIYLHLLRHALHGKDKRGTNDDAVPGV